MGGNWQEIGGVFAEALDIAPYLRAEFLDRRCADNPDLKREVLRLLALNEHPDDFLDRPASQLLPSTSEGEPLLFSGDLVADRFRVVKLLGMGGMGEVYEAADVVLGERVALKTVRSSPEEALQLDARLRREVQLARRVTHRSVCRVHDVARHTLQDGREVIVLTMELVEGETLAARLRRKALPTEEALRIAAQIAGALDAAHAQGVLHRDVKPANVMLAAENGGAPRAVLTDFGIARATEQTGTAALTRAGAMIGTPEYMAPELLRGEPATAQTDLYAFALIVCEMLSGIKTTVGAFSAKAFEARAADGGGADAGRGRSWARALTTALNPAPEHRFPTAGALVAALERDGLRPRVRWRKAAAAVAAAVLLALLAVAFRYYRQTEPRLAPASRVLLAPTTNGTGEPDFDGAGEILRSQLAQSAHFELVSEERVEAVLKLMKRTNDTAFEPPIAREVALREAAALVVYSSVTRIGPEVHPGHPPRTRRAAAGHHSEQLDANLRSAGARCVLRQLPRGRRLDSPGSWRECGRPRRPGSPARRHDHVLVGSSSALYECQPPHRPGAALGSRRAVRRSGADRSGLRDGPYAPRGRAHQPQA